jgi:hypothetical protein
VEVPGQTFPKKVLHGLHVVVRRGVLAVPLRLDSLHDLRVLVVERLVDGPKRLAFLVGDLDRRGVQFRQRDQVLNLDAGAGALERGLARVRSDRVGVACVSAIERRDGFERGAIGHNRECDRTAKKAVGGRSAVFRCGLKILIHLVSSR